jgi:PHD/YefM family antitoxin component YafN of YafNO toxin-antitoxin module
MTNDRYNRVDLLGATDEVRSAVRVTEVTGVRTLFTKEDRPVAILLSWDEYLALSETVRLGGDAGRLERIRAADAELTRTGGLPLEDALEL